MRVFVADAGALGAVVASRGAATAAVVDTDIVVAVSVLEPFSVGWQRAP